MFFWPKLRNFGSFRGSPWAGAAFSPTADPGVSAAELSIGEAALQVRPAEAAALYAELLSLAS